MGVDVELAGGTVGSVVGQQQSKTWENSAQGIGVELPCDYPKRKSSGCVHEYVTAELTSVQYDDLVKFSKEIGKKIPVIIFAVYAGLLYRLSQQPKLTLGVEGYLRGPTNENEPLQKIIHFEVDDRMSFDQLLVQADEMEESGTRSAGMDISEVNVLFCLGTEVTFGTAIDFALQLEPANQIRRLLVYYNKRLFRSERVREFLNQFLVLMEGVVRDYSREIEEYSLLTDNARNILPAPDSRLEEPFLPPVTENILHWVHRTPQAPAIKHNGKLWTYADIHSSANSIAMALLASGVQPGETVGVLGERSGVFVSSMTGVLLAGYVLLTLDPDLPDERLRIMAEEAEAKALVCIGGIGNLATRIGGASLKLFIDEESGLLQDSSYGGKYDGSLPQVKPDDPAYIFFTSGSTGVPKGVKGQHKGLAHFIHWQRTEFNITAQDKVAQLTALSFDVLLRDIFLVLTAGGTICIPDKDIALNPSRIISWLKQQNVTLLHIVPSLARVWLNHAPEGILPDSLQKVFFAGEPLMDSLVEQWRSVFGGHVEIVNLYGPTETTLAKCFKRVNERPDPGVQPIGAPLPNTQVFILNKKRHQCGLNEAGEIAIRTPFRTLGYINNSEVLMENFIVNPLMPKGYNENDIFYLTGDRGLYRTDGVIEIHGRLDQQIKIRGIRIEPGEIESIINHYDSVREATVVAPVDKTGTKFLAAYVVAEESLSSNEESPFIQKLRGYLRESLPENLVPSAFVLLKELPLNPNGKINKKALPYPGRTAFVGGNYTPPENKLQCDLVEIWNSLLMLESIGIDDDFFDLGGHSLMAMELVQHIEKILKKPCSLPMIFQNRTIRLLADELESGRDVGKDAFVVSLQNTVKNPALFCIVGIHLYQHLADELASDCQCKGIFVPYEEDFLASNKNSAVALSVTIERMASDYVKVIQSSQEKGPYFLAGVSFGGILAFEIAQQLTRQGEPVALLVILDSMLPAALSRNWGMWMKEHLQNLKNEGLEYLFDKLKNRIRHYRKVRSRQSATLSLDNVGALRGQIYKQAERQYQIKPYNGHVVLVRAGDKSWFTSDISDPTYGWGKVVSDLDIIDVSGGHLDILSPPHVKELAGKLRPFLTTAIAF